MPAYIYAVVTVFNKFQVFDIIGINIILKVNFSSVDICIFSIDFVFVKYFDVFIRWFEGFKQQFLIKYNDNMVFCTDKR